MKLFFLQKKHINIVKNNNEPNPHHHWILILRFSGAFFIVLIAFSVYLLFQIRSDQIFQVSSFENNKTPSVNQKTLKRVTEIFDEKSLIYTNLEKDKPTFADPSL